MADLRADAPVELKIRYTAICPPRSAWTSALVFKEIQNAVSESPMPYSLRIEWNFNASFDEFSALIDCVSQINLLGSLIISSVYIGPSEAELIKRLIIQTQSLNEIRILDVALEDDSAWITILEALPANKTLDEFMFSISIIKRPLEPHALFSQASQHLEKSKFIRFFHEDEESDDDESFEYPDAYFNRGLYRTPLYLKQTDYSDSQEIRDLEIFTAWEIWRVLKCCRAIAGSRSKQGHAQVFPVEIYVMICEKLIVVADDWIGEGVLSLIVRCALDRTTIGKLCCVEVGFLNLAHICRRILAGM